MTNIENKIAIEPVLVDPEKSGRDQKGPLEQLSCAEEFLRLSNLNYLSSKGRTGEQESKKYEGRRKVYSIMQRIVPKAIRASQVGLLLGGIAKTVQLGRINEYDKTAGLYLAGGILAFGIVGLVYTQVKDYLDNKIYEAKTERDWYSNINSPRIRFK